jgi:hypothetical protein
MLGDDRRFETADRVPNAADVGVIEPIHRPEREAHAMQAERVVGAQSFEHLRLPPTGVEIVLGVDFEERDVRPPGSEGSEVRASLTDACSHRQRLLTGMAERHG